MQSEQTVRIALRTVSPQALAYTGLGLTTLCWASAFVAGKFALAEMTPLAVAVCRYAIAAAVLLPFAIRQPDPTASLRRARRPLMVMMACGGVLYPWLFLLSLSRTTATNTSLLIALNPVFTLLLSRLIGDRHDRGRIGGVLLALVGAATVISRGNWAVVGQLAGGGLNSGDLLAVCAAATWACFNVASHRVVRRLTSSFANCIIYGVGGMVLGALAWHERPWSQVAAASPVAKGSIVVMAVLSSAIAGQLFLFGVRTVGVNRTVIFVYLVPVLTAVLSAALLGERLYIAQAIGGASVLAGVYWTTKPSPP